jgi:HAMP domain-containing protein
VWNWVVWGALLVAICSAIAAAVVVLRRVRALVRSGTRVYSRAAAGLSALEAKAELAAAKAERVGEKTHELEKSVARLRRSIAQLGVLRTALDEIDTQFGWMRVFL